MATLIMPAATEGAGSPVMRQLLANVPIFGGLTEAQIDSIVATGTIGEAAAGLQIVGEGDAAASVFVVCAGELEVCKRGSHGGEVRLATLRAGDCVGEMSLIDIQPRSATVRALTPAILFRLGHGEIAKLYDRHPDVYLMLVMNIAREISRRLRLADQKLVEMGVPVAEMWQSERTHSAR